MTKGELRAEYLRFINLETIEDCLDLFDIFIKHLWNVSIIHHKDEVYSNANKNAIFINQMMFSKLIHLKKIVEGVGYKTEKEELNNIVDPTIVASLTRNIFESVALFNLIFRNTKTDNEKDIIYFLWVISGLKYRQRFESFANAEESKRKLKEENELIKSLEKKIKETELYKSLDAKNQGKINEKIKKKDFKIRFDNKKVIYLSWQEMCDVMLELNKEICNGIYTYFSLSCHPSYVSVFQFENMFSKVNNPYKSLTMITLKYCFSFISVFIADYINLFPQVNKTFEKLETVEQIVLNAYNKILRGDSYSINESWKNLE